MVLKDRVEIEEELTKKLNEIEGLLNDIVNPNNDLEKLDQELENLENKYKEFNTVSFQAEDEIASIASAIGASFSGSLAVTGSSGPGIALKGEALGLAIKTELPLVVVNVQRAGPSTGMPTKTEQADLLQSLYGRHGEAPLWELETETTYFGALPENAPPDVIATGVLAELEQEGRFSVRQDAESGRYEITRHHPVHPRRIVFDPATAGVSVERLEFRTPSFLSRMHTRRNYMRGWQLENAWALSVDVVVVAMVFWVASGLWMWWTLRGARKWGAIFGLSGAALFSLFVIAI